MVSNSVSCLMLRLKSHWSSHTWVCAAPRGSMVINGDLVLKCWVPNREVMATIFKVFGLTQPGDWTLVSQYPSLHAVYYWPVIGCKYTNLTCMKHTNIALKALLHKKSEVWNILWGSVKFQRETKWKINGKNWWKVRTKLVDTNIKQNCCHDCKYSPKQPLDESLLKNQVHKLNRSPLYLFFSHIIILIM